MQIRWVIVDALWSELLGTRTWYVHYRDFSGYISGQVLMETLMKQIFIKDIKSSNGTFINDERLSPEGLESEPYEIQSDDIVVSTTYAFSTCNLISHVTNLAQTSSARIIRQLFTIRQPLAQYAFSVNKTPPSPRAQKPINSPTSSITHRTSLTYKRSQHHTSSSSTTPSLSRLLFSFHFADAPPSIGPN